MISGGANQMLSAGELVINLADDVSLEVAGTNADGVACLSTATACLLPSSARFFSSGNLLLEAVYVSGLFHARTRIDEMGNSFAIAHLAIDEMGNPLTGPRDLSATRNIFTPAMPGMPGTPATGTNRISAQTVSLAASGTQIGATNNRDLWLAVPGSISITIHGSTITPLRLTGEFLSDQVLLTYAAGTPAMREITITQTVGNIYLDTLAPRFTGADVTLKALAGSILCRAQCATFTTNGFSFEARNAIGSKARPLVISETLDTDRILHAGTSIFLSANPDANIDLFAIPQTSIVYHTIDATTNTIYDTSLMLTGTSTAASTFAPTFLTLDFAREQISRSTSYDVSSHTNLLLTLSTDNATSNAINITGAIVASSVFLEAPFGSITATVQASNEVFITAGYEANITLMGNSMGNSTITATANSTITIDLSSGNMLTLKDITSAQGNIVITSMGSVVAFSSTTLLKANSITIDVASGDIGSTTLPLRVDASHVSFSTSQTPSGTPTSIVISSINLAPVRLGNLSTNNELSSSVVFQSLSTILPAANNAIDSKNVVLRSTGSLGSFAQPLVVTDLLDGMGTGDTAFIAGDQDGSSISIQSDLTAVYDEVVSNSYFIASPSAPNLSHDVNIFAGGTVISLSQDFDQTTKGIAQSTFAQLLPAPADRIALSNVGLSLQSSLRIVASTPTITAARLRLDAPIIGCSGTPCDMPSVLAPFRLGRNLPITIVGSNITGSFTYFVPASSGVTIEELSVIFTGSSVSFTNNPLAPEALPLTLPTLITNTVRNLSITFTDTDALNINGGFIDDFIMPFTNLERLTITTAGGITSGTVAVERLTVNNLALSVAGGVGTIVNPLHLDISGNTTITATETVYTDVPDRDAFLSSVAFNAPSGTQLFVSGMAIVVPSFRAFILAGANCPTLRTGDYCVSSSDSYSSLLSNNVSFTQTATANPELYITEYFLESVASGAVSFLNLGSLGVMGSFSNNSVGVSPTVSNLSFMVSPMGTIDFDQVAVSLSGGLTLSAGEVFSDSTITASQLTINAATAVGTVLRPLGIALPGSLTSFASGNLSIRSGETVALRASFSLLDYLPQQASESIKPILFSAAEPVNTLYLSQSSGDLFSSRTINKSALYATGVTPNKLRVIVHAANGAIVSTGNLIADSIALLAPTSSIGTAGNQIVVHTNASPTLESLAIQTAAGRTAFVRTTSNLTNDTLFARTSATIDTTVSATWAGGTSLQAFIAPMSTVLLATNQNTSGYVSRAVLPNQGVPTGTTALQLLPESFTRYSDATITLNAPTGLSDPIDCVNFNCDIQLPTNITLTINAQDADAQDMIMLTNSKFMVSGQTTVILNVNSMASMVPQIRLNFTGGSNDTVIVSSAQDINSLNITSAIGTLQIGTSQATTITTLVASNDFMTGNGGRIALGAITFNGLTATANQGDISSLPSTMLVAMNALTSTISLNARSIGGVAPISVMGGTLTATLQSDATIGPSSLSLISSGTVFSSYTPPSTGTIQSFIVSHTGNLAVPSNINALTVSLTATGDLTASSTISANTLTLSAGGDIGTRITPLSLARATGDTVYEYQARHQIFISGSVADILPSAVTYTPGSTGLLSLTLSDSSVNISTHINYADIDLEIHTGNNNLSCPATTGDCITANSVLINVGGGTITRTATNVDVSQIVALGSRNNYGISLTAGSVTNLSIVTSEQNGPLALTLSAGATSTLDSNSLIYLGNFSAPTGSTVTFNSEVQLVASPTVNGTLNFYGSLYNYNSQIITVSDNAILQLANPIIGGKGGLSYGSENNPLRIDTGDSITLMNAVGAISGNTNSGSVGVADNGDARSLFLLFDGDPFFANTSTIVLLGQKSERSGFGNYVGRINLTASIDVSTMGSAVSFALFAGGDMGRITAMVGVTIFAPSLYFFSGYGASNCNAGECDIGSSGAPIRISSGASEPAFGAVVLNQPAGAAAFLNRNTTANWDNQLAGIINNTVTVFANGMNGSARTFGNTFNTITLISDVHVLTDSQLVLQDLYGNNYAFINFAGNVFIRRSQLTAVVDGTITLRASNLITSMIDGEVRLQPNVSILLEVSNNSGNATNGIYLGNTRISARGNGAVMLYSFNGDIVSNSSAPFSISTESGNVSLSSQGGDVCSGNCLYATL